MPLKVEGKEEEEETLPTRVAVLQGMGATRVRAPQVGLTCWWVRCPSSLYPSASTRAPSREISVWMWW